MNANDKPQESLKSLNARIKSLPEDKREAFFSKLETNQQWVDQKGQRNVSINQANGDISINYGVVGEEDIRSILLLLQQQFQKLPSLSPEEQKKAVCRFLEDVGEKKSNQLKQSIASKDEYIPIQVTLECDRKTQSKEEYPIQGELEKLIGSRSDRKTQSKEEYPIQGELKKLSQEQVNWQKVKQQHKIITVLADPGMGKSMLLNMEAITTAQDGLKQLNDNPDSSADIILPLPLRLSELAKFSEELIVAIPNLIQKNYPKTAPDIDFLRKKLEDGQCLLLLDGLDEVPRSDNKRNDLREKLNRFVSDYPCQLICTSRIVGYEKGFITEAKEVEIVQFNEKQINDYIKIRFSNAEAVSASNLLTSKAKIRGLAKNPLLLSLICRLYQNQELTLTRRCQVYEQTVEYILEKWSSKQNRRNSQQEFSKEAKMQLLEELAYHFTCAEQETFKASDLNSQIEKYLRGEQIHSELKNTNTRELITVLSEEIGILRKLDEDGNQYLFLHRTFQEYLTAKYLVRKTENEVKDGIDLAKAHIWEDYWHEILSLMAGLMNNPLPMLEMIVNEKDDIFRTHLLLAGRCIAECQEDFLQTDSLTKKIIEQIFEFWQVYPEADFIQSIIEAIAQVCSKAADKLKEAINHEDWYVQLSAAKAVATIGDAQSVRSLLNHKNPFAQKIAIDFLVEIDSADANIVKDLIATVQDEKNTFFVQNKALLALHKIGSADTIDALNMIANNHKNVYVRVIAAEALVEIDTLRKFFNHEDNEVRWAAVNALENIGNDDANKAIASLIDNNTIFSQPFLCKDVVNAWEKIGGIDAVKTLATVIENTGDIYGFGGNWAAEALEKIGTVDAVEALHKAINVLSENIENSEDNSLIQFRNLWVIDALIEALKNISTKATEATEAAKQVLNTISTDESIDVSSRWNAYVALGKLRVPDVLEMIAIMAYQDENSNLKRKAIEAVAEIGNFDLDISDDSSNNTHTFSIVSILFRAFYISEDKDVKLSALMALGKLGVSCITKENLVAWFGDEVEKRDEFDLTVFFVAALEEKDSSLRLRAVQALGKIGNSDAARVSFVMKALAKALNDQEEKIQENALEALKQIGDANAVRILLKALYHPNRSIQESALKALEEIFSPDKALEEIFSTDVVDALVALLKDEDISIRESAVQVLEKISNISQVTSDILLFRLIQLPKPVIYTPAVFLFTRTLAISWYSQLIKNMRSYKNKDLVSSPIEQIISWLPNLFQNLVLAEDDIVSMRNIVKEQREIERQKQVREWQQRKKESQHQEEVSDIDYLKQSQRLFYRPLLTNIVRQYQPYFIYLQITVELDENELHKPQPKLKQQQAEKLVEINQIKPTIDELPPTDSDSSNNPLFQQNTHDESTAIPTEISQMKRIFKSSNPFKGSIFESAFAQEQSKGNLTEE